MAIGAAVRRRRQVDVKPYFKMLRGGIFPFDVLVAVGMKLPEVRKHLSRKYGPEIVERDIESFNQEEGDGRTIHLSGHQTVIWLREAPTTAKGIGCLCHEALHAISFMYDAMGCRYDMKCGSDEFYAYGVEWIAKQVVSDFLD